MKAQAARPPRNGDVQIMIPIYNEGANVRTVYSALVEAAPSFANLKFVYDLDDDTSLPYLDEIAAADPRVCAEKNQYGRGVVHALRWGFAHARCGPLIVVMGDNSDDLSVIPRMVDLWRVGATVVSASRYMPGGVQQGGPLLKRTLSRLAGRSLGWCGFPTCDPTNNFKLYDGDWIRRQTIQSTGGFEVALELCYKAFREGATIVEVPTVWRDRTDGESRFRLFAWLGHYLRWYVRALGAVILRRCESLLGRKHRPATIRDNQAESRS